MLMGFQHYGFVYMWLNYQNEKINFDRGNMGILNTLSLCLCDLNWHLTNINVFFLLLLLLLLRDKFAHFTKIAVTYSFFKLGG